MHTVDLRLRERKRVGGTIRNATGQPVSGVPMLLWNHDGDGWGYYANWNGSGYGNSYGRNALTGVSMQLEVRNPPAPYVRQVVELPPVELGGSRDIQLRTVPSLTIPHTTVVEGDGADGERTVLLTASLSVPRSQTGVTFDLQVVGTADAADYRLPSTRITIPRFRSRAEIPIVIVGDDIPEPDETIELRITNITGAAWNPGPGSLRILNDDPMPGQGSRCTGTTVRMCE
nr:hypothetical protein WG33_0394 [uncultured bacterium]